MDAHIGEKCPQALFKCSVTVGERTMPFLRVSTARAQFHLGYAVDVWLGVMLVGLDTEFAVWPVVTNQSNYGYRRIPGSITEPDRKILYEHEILSNEYREAQVTVGYALQLQVASSLLVLLAVTSGRILVHNPFRLADEVLDLLVIQHDDIVGRGR